MLRFFSFIILSCLTFSAHALPSFAVGKKWEYIDYPSQRKIFPFLVQSTDDGETWAQKDIPALDEMHSAWFHTGDCGDLICVAGGGSSYNPKLINLFQTTNEGHTWDKVIVNNLDPTDNDIFFNSASCHGSVCALLGTVYNDDYYKTIRKYIAVSTQDSGKTWTSVNLNNIILNFSYTALDCYENYCLAVGENYNGPGMIESFDGGLTWSKVLLNNSVTAKSFHAVNCHAEGCTVLGWYSNSTQILARILQSNAGKNIWNEIIPPTPPSDRDWTGLNSITCNDNGCIAVGYFGLTSAGKYWIAHSDKNKQWAFEILPIKSGEVEARLHSVDCTSSYCMAIGGADKKNEHHSVIFTNETGSWVSMDLPPKIQLTNLGALSCNKNSCIAAGETPDNIPSLIQTNKKGKWKTVSVDNMPHQGWFYDTVNP